MGSISKKKSLNKKRKTRLSFKTQLMSKKANHELPSE